MPSTPNLSLSPPYKKTSPHPSITSRQYCKANNVNLQVSAHLLIHKKRTLSYSYKEGKNNKTVLSSYMVGHGEKEQILTSHRVTVSRG